MRSEPTDFPTIIQAFATKDSKEPIYEEIADDRREYQNVVNRIESKNYVAREKSFEDFERSTNKFALRQILIIISVFIVSIFVLFLLLRA